MLKNKKTILGLTILTAVAILLSSCAASGGGSGSSSNVIKLKDPKGDDKGPGNYTYPTDPVYTPGSFDLIGTDIVDKGDMIDFKVKFNAPVSFAWGDAWDVQQIHIYLDTKPGSGYTDAIPGTGVMIDKDNAWEKVIFVDPHSVVKQKSEIELKAKSMQADIVIPASVRPIGKSLGFSVKKSDLGLAPDADIKKIGYGVLMLSATGFPGDWLVLMRRANEYNGQHRFGGGSDGAGDPNVMDLIAGQGKGDPSEIQMQYDMLKNWESSADPDETQNNKLTTIKLVYPM